MKPDADRCECVELIEHAANRVPKLAKWFGERRFNAGLIILDCLLFCGLGVGFRGEQRPKRSADLVDFGAGDHRRHAKHLRAILAMGLNVADLAILTFRSGYTVTLLGIADGVCPSFPVTSSLRPRTCRRKSSAPISF